MSKIPEFTKAVPEQCTLPECEEHLLYLRYLLRREANTEKQAYYRSYIAKLELRLQELQVEIVQLKSVDY